MTAYIVQCRFISCNDFKWTLVLFPAVAIFARWCVAEVEDLALVPLYNAGHITHTTIADFCVLPVEDLVKSMSCGEMFVY